MSNDKGAILLVVIIIILTISLLGATLTALFFNVLTSSQTELDRAQALYLAEAGIAKAVNALRTQAGSGQAPDESGSSVRQIIPPTALGNGIYEVYNDFNQSVIISVGISNKVKRTIQMKYNAF